MKTRRRIKKRRATRKGGMFRSALTPLKQGAKIVAEGVVKSKTQDEFKNKVKSWENKENNENVRNSNTSMKPILYGNF
jgi:hypothetical protein